MANRFDAIDYQIHRNLLQLHPVPDYRRQTVCQFRANGYTVSRGFIPQQGNGFPGDLVEVDIILTRNTSRELRADPADDRRAPG